MTLFDSASLQKRVSHLIKTLDVPKDHTFVVLGGLTQHGASVAVVAKRDGPRWTAQLALEATHEWRGDTIVALGFKTSF